MVGKQSDGTLKGLIDCMKTPPVCDGVQVEVWSSDGFLGT